METRFVEATTADSETIVDLMRQMYLEAGYEFDEAASRRSLAGFVGDASLGLAWIIRDGATAVGYLVLTFGYSFEYRGRDAFIDELFILKSHRGRGLGRAAMQLLEAACREHGVNALHLEVERDNDAATALYRKFGFEEHDRLLMTRWMRREP